MLNNYLQEEAAARIWPCDARPTPGSGGSAGTPSPTERAAALLPSLVATGEAAAARAPAPVAGVVGAMADLGVRAELVVGGVSLG